MIRIVLGALVVLLGSLNLWAQEKNHSKYPFVSQINGPVFLVMKDGKNEKLKKSDVLHEKAHLLLKHGAQVRLELGEKDSLTVLQDSEVDIPLINWESSKVDEISLLSGQIRVDTDESSSRLYTTPITHDAYTNADFLLTYDPHQGRTHLMVFRGALDFRGLEGELVARVGPGETAYFQSILENGAPSFDVLLKGRRVARGRLSAVDSIPKNELLKYSRATLVQKPAVTAVKKKVRQADQICDEPLAKLNECVWTCEGLPKKLSPQIKSCEDPRLHGTQCLRRRCNANGEWADPYKIPVSEGKCQLRPIVAVCDY
jgi:hypothetical protein